MEIYKLYAVIEKRLPDSIRSINQVVGIRFEDNSLITDHSQIAKEFPNDGKIFTARTFAGANDLGLNEGELVEIPVKEIHPKDADKPIQVDHLTIVKKNASRIIEIPAACLEDDSIELSMVNSFFDGVIANISGDIYLSISDYFYGPFKFNNQKIEPKTGKEVGKYKYLEDGILDYGETSFLLDKVTNELCKIDCMSSAQIMDWVKEKINVYGEYSGDLNKIKTLLKKSVSDSQSLNALDQIRFERSKKYLDALELTFEELKLLKEDPRWKTIFENSYDKHKEKFRVEYLNDLEGEFKSLASENESKISELNKKIKSLTGEIRSGSDSLNNISAEIEVHQNELDYILDKKTELIVALRLQAGGETAKQSEPSSTPAFFFEMQEFENACPDEFSSMEEYLNELKEKLHISTAESRLFEDGLNILFNKRFILSNNIFLVLSILRSQGNVTLCLQQAEPDWLKFDRWFDKGLTQMLDSSSKHPYQKHFFVLQDFNIPSFECYGRPLMDIAAGIRQFIPGTNKLWPTNLYVILISVNSEIEGLGFAINEATFRNWGVMPFAPDFNKYSEFILSKIMNLETLEAEMQRDFNGDIAEYLR